MAQGGRRTRRTRGRRFRGISFWVDSPSAPSKTKLAMPGRRIGVPVGGLGKVPQDTWTRSPQPQTDHRWCNPRPTPGPGQPDQAVVSIPASRVPVRRAGWVRSASRAGRAPTPLGPWNLWADRLRASTSGPEHRPGCCPGLDGIGVQQDAPALQKGATSATGCRVPTSCCMTETG